MRKDYTFIVSAMMIGIVLALMSMAILGAIAMPAHNNYILTHAEKADMDLIASRFTPALEYSKYILWVLVPLMVFAMGLFLRAMNPRLGKDTIRLRPGLYKAIVVVVALVLAGVLFAKIVDLHSGIVVLLASSVLMGCLWMVLGDMGWAGDFSSWKPGTAERGPELLKCFAYGAVMGAVAVGVLSLTSIAFNKYFVLVSEVLDGSDDISSRGFELFLYGLLVLFVFNAGVLASLALALSPSVKARAERIKNLAIALVLICACLVMSYGIYLNAVDKYDLDTKNLAEAVGIPEDASESFTLVPLSTLEGETPAISNWPLSVSSFSLAGGGSIAVSSDNLSKVGEYLKGHPEGTVHKYSALDTLCNGYIVLFEPALADKALIAASREIMYARLLLLRRLTVVPVTQGNIEMVTSFADEEKWVVRGRSAYALFRALVHMGLIDEARKWEARAIEDGHDVNEPVVPEGPVLTDGAIKGRLRFNGVPLKHGRIALVNLSGDSINLELFNVASNLVAVREFDADGAFDFESLGNGRYVLLLVADDSVVGEDIEKLAVTLKGNTSVIELDHDNSLVNLGTIELYVESSEAGAIGEK